MKLKFLAILLLITGSGLMFTSCHSDDDVSEDSIPIGVRFGSDIIQTKTTNGGNHWTKNDPIGVFMVKNGQMLSSTNIAEGADNRKYQAQAGGSNINGFAPVGTDVIYYPHDGSNVDFVAYYPYRTALTNYIYPVDVTNQATPADIDVLYANTANTNLVGYNKTSGMVDLQFNHALSKLSFTLTSGDGSPNLTGAKLQITNLATTADIDLADGTVTATNSGRTLTANTSTDGLSSSAIVIPQTLSGTKLIVTLVDNVSKFEWVFPANTKLQASKNHQFEITVNKTGIIVSSGGITTWTGTGDPVTPGTAATLTQYKIGDYYPDPTNSSTAIGVVFWLDPAAWGYNSSGTPTGYFGKIVSMDEPPTKLEWGINQGYNFLLRTFDASNGRINTRKLVQRIAVSEAIWDNYPVFKWVHSKNLSQEEYANENVRGVWYLPAENELKSLYDMIGSVAPVLQNAGGALLKSDLYWSSTESNIGGAAYLGQFVNMNTGSSNMTNKDTQRYVRAILAF